MPETIQSNSCILSAGLQSCCCCSSAVEGHKKRGDLSRPNSVRRLFFLACTIEQAGWHRTERLSVEKDKTTSAPPLFNFYLRVLPSKFFETDSRQRSAWNPVGERSPARFCPQ